VLVKYFAVKQPGTNKPLTFEIGRGYSFFVRLGDPYVEFGDVVVSTYNNYDSDGVDITPHPDPVTTKSYMPIPHMGFAGSNIYWDAVNERLTFDDVVDDYTDAPNRTKQGLFFKWGSLIGISPLGTPFSDDTKIYAPIGATGEYEVTSPSALYDPDPIPTTPREWWDLIEPYLTSIAFIPNVDDLRLSGYATYLNSVTANLAAYKGDICAYLSGRDGIPAGEWRLPTNAEFEPGYDPDVPFVSPGDYSRVGSFTIVSVDADHGTFEIPNGYTLTYTADGATKTTFFPASGYWNYTGTLGSVRYQGVFMSSSPIGSNGYYMSFNNIDPGPKNSNVRSLGSTVRCVKK
jgi:hypothetical protein